MSTYKEHKLVLSFARCMGRTFLLFFVKGLAKAIEMVI